MLGRVGEERRGGTGGKLAGRVEGLRRGWGGGSACFDFLDLMNEVRGGSGIVL
jgi:hypothetical protein